MEEGWCEIEGGKDQTDISTAEISKNETFEIHDESGLSSPSSDTIADQENSQSSNNNSQNIPNEVTSNSDNSENISESAFSIKNYTKVPKINHHIVYINPELNTREKAVSISRAGKATGKNKYRFNVKSIDTGSFMRDWAYLEEVLVNNITESDYSTEILKAKMDEFENWKDQSF